MSSAPVAQVGLQIARGGSRPLKMLKPIIFAVSLIAFLCLTIFVPFMCQRGEKREIKGLDETQRDLDKRFAEMERKIRLQQELSRARWPGPRRF